MIGEGLASYSVLHNLLYYLFFRSEAIFSSKPQCPIVCATILRCIAQVITATPCQRTIELFFEFMGPQLVSVINATGNEASEKVDSLPGDSQQAVALCKVVCAVLEVLEAASFRSNVPLDLIDMGLDYLVQLMRYPTNAEVREKSYRTLQRLLTKKHCGDVFARAKKRSGALIAELASRSQREKNAEALAALLGLMSQLAPLTPSFPDAETTLQLVAYLLERSRRQEVALAALPLAGRLWRLGATEQSLRKRIVAEVQRRSGWDQGPEMREACTVALKELFAAGEREFAEKFLSFGI